MGKLAEAFVEIGSRQQKLDKDLESSRIKLTEFVAHANGILGTIGVGLGIAEAGRFIGEITTKAADLGETMSKVEQTFGASKNIVISMADNMATRFGAVRRTTLDAASALGLVGQGAGLSAEQAAKMSVKLTRLADDASSFYNVPLEEALQKIRSGMVGEAEPLRAFGVLLSEANMKAAALTMGFKPLHGELTESEKVMARVKIITEGLSKAQGDHERTLGSYTNQIRKLNGEWENLKAEMGAPIASTAALLMQRGREVASKTSMFELMTNPIGIAAELGKSFQNQADLNAGVNKTGPVATTTLTQGQKAFQELQATFNAIRKAEDERNFEAKRFIGSGGGGIGGPFGMFGTLGFQLAGKDLRGKEAEILAGGGSKSAEIGRKIKELEAERGAWAGSHITDTEAFMRQAQEKILEKPNKQLDEQIKELKEHQILLSRIAENTGKQNVGGLVLKGRTQ